GQVDAAVRPELPGAAEADSVGVRGGSSQGRVPALPLILSGRGSVATIRRRWGDTRGAPVPGHTQARQPISSPPAIGTAGGTREGAGGHGIGGLVLLARERRGVLETECERDREGAGPRPHPLDDPPRHAG